MDAAISKKFKRALVTGGAGFVGSHLCDSLLADGIEVISVDDYSAGKRENLEKAREYSTFKEVKHDITDRAGLVELLKGVDVVFHQACSKNTICLKDPLRDMAVNAEGTLNMLLAAKEAGVKKFVHASTGSVYGEPAVFPSDEHHALDPVSYYGVSKLAGDRYARLFSSLHGMDVTILRYYHVFGPRQDNSDVGGVVSIFGRRCLEGKPIIIYGDGTQIRSFTYVQDVVRINKLAAVTEGISGQAYNCASGIKVTIRELAEAIRSYLGAEATPIVHEDWKMGDIKYFQVDNSKLKKLGFEFKWEFKEGLAKTMESVKEHFSAKRPG